MHLTSYTSNLEVTLVGQVFQVYLINIGNKLYSRLAEVWYIKVKQLKWST